MRENLKNFWSNSQDATFTNRGPRIKNFPLPRAYRDLAGALQLCKANGYNKEQTPGSLQGRLGWNLAF
jgi:hypothetical protein